MKFWCVIPAAGRGARFGADHPKQFCLLQGQSVLTQTVSRFLPHPDLAGIQLVLPPGMAAPDDLPDDSRIQFSQGGASRRDSVLSGCRDLLSSRQAAPADRVLVHDAARPLLPRADLQAVLEQMAHSAAYLVAPVADTLRDHAGQTLDRDQIWRVLTPQGAGLGQLIQALQSTEAELTDEVAYLQQIGVQAQAVPGNPINQKITWPADLRWANSMINELDP